MHLYYVSAQLSQIRTLKSAQPEDALYQLWQCLLKTDLPQFYAILGLNLYKKKQMTINFPLVESQKLGLKCLYNMQYWNGKPPWYNSKLAPLDKLSPPKEWLQAGVWSIGQVWLNKSKHLQFELQNLLLRKNTIKARAQWELSIDFITDDRWTQVLLTPLNISPIYKYRILQLYLIHRAYYTRSRLHKINPEYWAEIQKRITKILGFELPLNSKWYILGMDPPNQLTRPAQKIFQACRLIAQQWKSQAPPQYADWEKSVQNMCNVEQLIARRNNNSDQCMTIWQLWFWKMYN
ncbi:hypothetical protein XELAEV_18031411mg [Xenopus laevis]|uniref:Uncharacterized protein n=1 Tax=Xenopus laevis TaxID=8355 RepID=A0A974CMJ5_XENLA|nr:hypothetical protein XELAEV_18031411mg [Xenopus laevis]